MIWQIIAVVFGTGCVGGLISGVFFRPNKLGLSYQGEICGTYFPGLAGNILLGGVAAVLFWCLYGPFSGATIIGAPSDTNVSLTVGQLASCLLIGTGGAGCGGGVYTRLTPFQGEFSGGLIIRISPN